MAQLKDFSKGFTILSVTVVNAGGVVGNDMDITDEWDAAMSEKKSLKDKLAWMRQKVEGDC